MSRAATIIGIGAVRADFAACAEIRWHQRSCRQQNWPLAPARNQPAGKRAGNSSYTLNMAGIKATFISLMLLLRTSKLPESGEWQYELFLRIPADSTQVIEHTWQLYGAVSDRRAQIG
jgi:hypothetical protein